MSLIGSYTAVVSLGMSCQAAKQVEQQVDLLKELIGDQDLLSTRLPFDWLICPPLPASQRIRENKYFPDSPDEIVINVAACWLGKNLFYWDEFREHAPEGSPEPTITSMEIVHAHFEDMTSKYKHITGSWNRLHTLDRRFFVFQNLQDNLPHIRDTTGSANHFVTRVELERLIESVRATFGNDDPFLFMLRRDRIDQAPEGPGIMSIVCEPEASGDYWLGRADVWEAALRKFIPAPIPRKPAPPPAPPPPSPPSGFVGRLKAALGSRG